MNEPHYIAIEGMIGAGKTTLAMLLADRLSANLILEEVEDNPFLEKFYDDPERFAFQTQIFFLLSRYRQQLEIPSPDLFGRKVISDYCFVRDKIFARVNLKDDELFLYERILSLLEPRVPKPDFVVHLQASTEMLLDRIKNRGRNFEADIDINYIRALNEAYNHFFFHYDETPLLVINMREVDFFGNTEHVDNIIDQIKSPHAGTRYYVPFLSEDRK
jgi:deoxyadenosine/deoxycytidine kinase